MKEPPSPLLKDPHFRRYWQTWRANEESIAFVPVAEFYREKRFLDEAEEVCRQGLLHNPDSVSGRMVLAKILWDKGEVAKVRELVCSILQGAPDHQEARNLFGRAEESLKEEVTERQMIPELMKPWETVSMAEVYFSQGEFKTAFEICRTLMERDPLDERARRLHEKVGKILLERWGKKV